MTHFFIYNMFLDINSFHKPLFHKQTNKKLILILVVTACMLQIEPIYKNKYPSSFIRVIVKRFR